MFGDFQISDVFNFQSKTKNSNVDFNHSLVDFG